MQNPGFVAPVETMRQPLKFQQMVTLHAEIQWTAPSTIDYTFNYIRPSNLRLVRPPCTTKAYEYLLQVRIFFAVHIQIHRTPYTRLRTANDDHVRWCHRQVDSGTRSAWNRVLKATCKFWLVRNGINLTSSGIWRFNLHELFHKRHHARSTFLEDRLDNHRLNKC